MSNETHADSAAAESRARVRGHPGIHSSRLQNADGTAFPVDSRRPAEARRQLGRLVSGDESDAPQITTAEDWHVGFGPGHSMIRRVPRVASQTIASTSVSRGPGWWRWICRSTSRRYRSSHWRVHRRSRAPGGVDRRYRSKCGRDWGGGFGTGHDHVLVTLHAISPEAMKGYSDRLCAWFAEEMPFERSAPRRDGIA